MAFSDVGGAVVWPESQGSGLLGTHFLLLLEFSRQLLGMGCKKSHLRSAGQYMAASVLVVLAEGAFGVWFSVVGRGHGVAVTWAHTVTSRL